MIRIESTPHEQALLIPVLRSVAALLEHDLKFYVNYESTVLMLDLPYATAHHDDHDKLAAIEQVAFQFSILHGLDYSA